MIRNFVIHNRLYYNTTANNREMSCIILQPDMVYTFINNTIL